MTISEKLHNLTHKKWDFDLAKEIYDAHGDSDLLKFLFAEPWSEFIDEQLKEAIRDLARENPIVEHEIKEARKEEIQSLQVYKGRLPYPEDEINYPKELQELVLKRKQLFAEANHARYMLFTKSETEEERKQLAFTIKSNWREIERIWGILNYWKTHKALSPDIIQVNTGGMTVKEMGNRIKNLRTYISKIRSGKKKYKMTIEEMQAELNDLERRLNGIV